MSYLNNVDNVREQIEMNNLNIPFHATINYANSVVTDYDTFPYHRWYRGQAISDVPIVAEREAGWRPQRNRCYKDNTVPPPKEYPNHCFEGPCSVTYPCYPKYLQKYSDRAQMNVLLNKSCVTQYR